MAPLRPLCIYMPVVHGALAAGLALSFARAGLLMRLSGPTMAVAHPVDTRYAAADAAALFGPHVSAYEGEEILTDPPDVVMVGNPANEASSLELVRTLRRTHPVAFVAYSGVFQSRYTYPLYNAVVANDVASRLIARYHGVPAIKYFPDMDFEFYRARREPPAERVVLRSYINDFETRFPLSAEFFAACRSVCAERFGDRVLIENISREGRNETRRKMIDSTASLSIKDSEGFGYAILEAMAIGRPLISQRGLSRLMAYNEFAIEGRSHLLIDTPDDLVPIVERLLADPAWRRELQDNAAADARSIDADAQAAALRALMEAVTLLARARWGAPRSGPPQPIPKIVPSLDPAARQPFEAIILGGRSAAEADERA